MPSADENMKQTLGELMYANVLLRSQGETAFAQLQDATKKIAELEAKLAAQTGADKAA